MICFGNRVFADVIELKWGYITIRVGPNSVTSKKSEAWTWTHRRECHMEVEAEIGVVLPQIPRIAGSHQKLEEAKKALPL